MKKRVKLAVSAFDKSKLSDIDFYFFTEFNVVKKLKFPEPDNRELKVNPSLMIGNYGRVVFRKKKKNIVYKHSRWPNDKFYLFEES